VFSPSETASFLKKRAGDARAWWFDTGVFKFLPCLTREGALAWSYVARALPPPAEDKSLLPAFEARLQTEPVPVHPDWKGWVASYLKRFKPRDPLNVDLFTQPSNHAALGYPRSLGGHQTGVQDLILLGAYLVHPSRSEVRSMDVSFGEESFDSRNQGIGMIEKLIMDRFTGLHEGPKSLATLADGGHRFFLRRMQEYLWAGVKYVLDTIELVPVLPIYAEEKGLKVRYPTCTLTAANLVQQVLRRAADSYFITILGAQGR